MYVIQKGLTTEVEETYNQVKSKIIPNPVEVGNMIFFNKVIDFTLYDLVGNKHGTQIGVNWYWIDKIPAGIKTSQNEVRKLVVE